MAQGRITKNYPVPREPTHKLSLMGLSKCSIFAKEQFQHLESCYPSCLPARVKSLFTSVCLTDI